MATALLSAAQVFAVQGFEVIPADRPELARTLQQTYASIPEFTPLVAVSRSFVPETDSDTWERRTTDLLRPGADS